MTKPITIELTFGKAVDLVEILKVVHGDSDWSVERALKGDLADLKENTYVLSSAETYVEKRAKVAALITTITGEPFGNPGEAQALADVRTAVNAYEPQPELEPVEV